MRQPAVGSFKTARDLNAKFARETAKIPFITNMYTLLPVDDTNEVDDDDIAAERERTAPKPKIAKKKPNIKLPPEEKVLRRKRNDDKKNDDLLRSKYSTTTIKVGSILDALNPILQPAGFRNLFDHTLIHW